MVVEKCKLFLFLFLDVIWCLEPVQRVFLYRIY